MKMKALLSDTVLALNSRYRFVKTFFKIGDWEKYKKTGIGRRKCLWLKNIIEWTGMDTPSLLRTARNRQRFAEIVADRQ